MSVADLQEPQTQFPSYKKREISYGELLPFHTFVFYGINVAVSVEHPQAFVLAQKIKDTLGICHKGLRKSCQFLVFPFDTQSGQEPTEPGVTAACAMQNPNRVLVFGKAHAKNHFQLVHPLILNHEFSHLVADQESGLPGSIQQEFLQACEKDAQSHDNLPMLRIHQEKDVFAKDIGMTRSFGYKSPLISSHASKQKTETSQNSENWAESVSLYLWDKQVGYIWQEGGQTLCFKQYYPYRAKVIEDFLQTL